MLASKRWDAAEEDVCSMADSRDQHFHSKLDALQFQGARDFDHSLGP